MTPDTPSKLGDDLMKMFDLPDDISTIITGERGELNAVAHEMLARMSETGQIKVGLAKVAYSLDRLNDHVERQNSRVSRQEERCDDIQAGESVHGCAHLGALGERVSRWVVAQSITMAILAAVGIAGMGFAVWAIQEIVSRR